MPKIIHPAQWPGVPGCDHAGMAGRSHPASEVRGSGQEELPRVRGQWRLGKTPHVHGHGGGWEELPSVQGQGQLGEPTSCPRPGAVTMRSHPDPEARVGSWEEPLTPEAKAGGWEEQPKERWLSRHRRA